MGIIINYYNMKTHTRVSSQRRRSREVALKMVLEVSLARFLPSTERDGASMLKRLLETRKTALKSQSQFKLQTAKSLLLSLTSQEKNFLSAKTSLPRPPAPIKWIEQTCVHLG